MNSRMERYKEDINLENTITRSMKNQDLYESVNSTEMSRVRTNNNVKVIDSGGREINIEKIKNYITSMNNEKQRQREKLFHLENDKSDEVKEEEHRDYDLNSVLEKARQGREIDYEKERYKKLHNTQYDILSKLKIYEEESTSDELEEFNTDERTLIDLINTVTIHKDEIGLLDELTGGSDNTEIMEPMRQNVTRENLKEDLKKEIIKEIEVHDNKNDIEKTQELVNIKEKESKLDKSFYTNSMSFSKEDFEGFEELEKTVKKNNTLVIISLIILVIAILATLFVIANYVFDLGLF